MDKHIKISEEVWKKVRLASTIDDTNVKALTTKYIMEGLNNRFRGNSKVLSDLGLVRLKRTRKIK